MKIIASTLTVLLCALAFGCGDPNEGELRGEYCVGNALMDDDDTVLEECADDETCCCGCSDNYCHCH